MTVPPLNDLSKLQPHGNAVLVGGKYVCKAAAGDIARVHYTVDFDHAEPFTISGRFFFPTSPPGGGLTCPLRVENYVEGTNRPLNRLEIDRFQDGSWRLVRNRLVAPGDSTGEYETIATVPSLPVGREFELAMACRLSTTANGYTAIYLDGNLILEHEGKNWSSPAMRVQRARFGIIQGGGGPSEVHVLAAKLEPGLVGAPTPPPPPPPPPPPDPEPDPCAAEKALLAKVRAEAHRTDNTPKQRIAIIKKLLP